MFWGNVVPNHSAPILRDRTFECTFLLVALLQNCWPPWICGLVILKSSVIFIDHYLCPILAFFSPSWNSNHMLRGIFSLHPPYLLASSFISSICLSPWAAFWIRSSDLASFTNSLFSSTSQIHGFLLLPQFLFLEHHRFFCKSIPIFKRLF